MLKFRVLKQIEYYFSDENLVRVKFLRNRIEENPDGWVHLNVLVKFRRLANLTTDTKLIGKLLSKTNSNIIEISKDKQRIRRVNNRPPPKKTDDNISDMILRSAYVDGFSQNVEIDQLIDFFDEATNIIIRKYFDRKTNTYMSKGSAFVTFPNQTKCDEFVAKRVILNGIPLKVMYQKAFIEEKKLAKQLAKQHKTK